MDWKGIIIWLVLFIVGSLIVSFLIYPSSFQSFKSNVEDIEVVKSVSNIGVTSIKDLTDNKDTYLGKEITISGDETGISISCSMDTCCSNIGYSGIIYDENKVKLSVKSTEDLSKGSEWKCKGQFKKETFNRLECEYSKKIGDTQSYNKDNCEQSPSEDCYYFDASFCECTSNYCGN